MSGEVTQLNVGGSMIGLLGLNEVFEEVQKLNLDESLCKQEILQRAKRQNYIPASAEASYAEALWREFRRWRGEKVEEESTGGLVIKVLGPGCYACDKMMQDLKEVLTELDLAADVEHVRDLNRIGKFGLVATAALVINNKVKASGRAPAKSKLREMVATEVNTQKG